MRDDFRVGLRIESIAFCLQLLSDLLEVFDDAVVYHADPIARHVRMGIAFNRCPMSRPSRVRDPDGAKQRFRIQAVRELFDLADPATTFDATRAVRNDRQPRGVVTAIFKPPESFDENSW